MTKTGNSLCIYSNENPALCKHFQIFGEPDIIQSWPRREKALVLNGVPVVYFGRTNGGKPIYWTPDGDTPAGKGVVKLRGVFEYRPNGEILPPEGSNALKSSTEVEFDMSKSTFSVWMDERGFPAPPSGRKDKTAAPTHKSEMYPSRFGSANILNAEHDKLIDWVWLSGYCKVVDRYMGGRVSAYDTFEDTKALRFSVNLRRDDNIVISTDIYDEMETTTHKGGFFMISHMYITGLSVKIENCREED